MGLESATYISDLVATNPTASDGKNEGDNHIRLLKSTVKATFPNVTGAVTASHTELNYLDGPSNLASVAVLADTGVLVRTAANTFAARVIVAGAGCVVTNGDGVSGNIEIALSPSTGAGDVLGPTSATDNALARFDGTSGKLVQGSSASLSDAGVLTVNGIVDGTGTGLPITGDADISGSLSVVGDASLAGNTTLAEVTETVYAITDGGSVDINPANGSIQTWTLGANRSPTATSFASGQSVTMMIDDGAGYTITWPSVTWINATAPTLATSGYTVVVLFKVGSTLYGAYVGEVA